MHPQDRPINTVNALGSARAMESVLLILPDFLVILLGLFLARKLDYPRAFWDKAEKLVFYVLFPPLLFNSVSSASIGLSSASKFLTVAVTGMLFAVLVAWCVRYVVKDSDWTHASVFQCGFRFNTYIGFAVASRLYGDEGTSLLALLIAFWVPISNAIAVSVLAAAVARKEAGAQAGARTNVFASTVKAVVRNPLIIATVLGLIVNVSGFKVPQTAHIFLADLGNASLAMGLLCIGAGLRTEDFRAHMPLIAASCVDRLLLVPLIAWGMGVAFGLSPVEAGVAIVFAALPTAQSCYVMTASMRGDAGAVANVTTAQTLAAMATLPFWLAFLLL